MLTSNKKIQERNTVPNNEQIPHSKNASGSFRQTLIALVCISFFPLVYLIGSSIVKYFG